MGYGTKKVGALGEARVPAMGTPPSNHNARSKIRLENEDGTQLDG